MRIKEVDAKRAFLNFRAWYRTRYTSESHPDRLTLGLDAVDLAPAWKFLGTQNPGDVYAFLLLVLLRAGSYDEVDKRPLADQIDEVKRLAVTGDLTPYEPLRGLARQIGYKVSLQLFAIKEKFEPLNPVRSKDDLVKAAALKVLQDPSGNNPLKLPQSDPDEWARAFISRKKHGTGAAAIYYSLVVSHLCEQFFGLVHTETVASFVTRIHGPHSLTKDSIQSAYQKAKNRRISGK